MKTEVKKLPRGQAEITIELTAEEYEPFLKQAAEQISLTTKIPGFRPGKADLGVVKKYVGEGEIWQQAVEPAVQKTFVRVVTEQNLLTVGSPKIEVIKLAPGNPVIYKATVNLLPEVKLTDYTKIKVKKNQVTVPDKEIQSRLSDLQKMRAKETLADRPAVKGDKIEIDFETFLDKVPIDHGRQKQFPLVIGENTFIPGFEDQLIGLKKDETKKFQLKFPGSYHQKNLAGRLCDFQVKVNAIYQLDLPQLNDEFAQSLGDFKTLKDIEDKIKEELQTTKENKENQRLEEEIFDKIISQSSFSDIPDIFIDSETKKMLQELEHNLGHQGLKFDDYLNHLKKTKEELALEFSPQAVKRVKSALVLRTVIEKNKINVSQDEIEAEIKKMLEFSGGDAQMAKELRQAEYLDYLHNTLISKKAVEHLKQVMAQS